jgi:tetratricopeptide (TPR) repeat protein/TolB-like protein
MPSICFEKFELDEQTLELRRDGTSVRLQQQPARVLAFLLNHRGTLVTREQIRLAIWGDDTFVDFEQGLNFCIRQIRLALNEQAEHPRFLETLPRLGYRFIAQIQKSNAPMPVLAENRVRIAVMPIEDISGQSEDYFAAGLTEDMISALSRIDQARLRVTSVPRLEGGDGSTDTMDRLQRHFNLDYLLRGTVRRSADRVRISAQLHDLRDKSVLWSNTYDRNASDLLAVQEEVAQNVSQSLALELLPSAPVGSRRYSRSPIAYDLYLRGRFFWHKMAPSGIESSISYFSEALAVDPAFAPAYAGLADCYAQMGTTRLGMMKPFAALDKARENLQRAMDLDYTIAEAHCTSALIKSWYEFDWEGSEREFQVALSLDPQNVTALIWRSLYLTVIGQHDESIASVQRARDAEPLSPITNTYLGASLANAGRFDLAIRQLNQALELDPNFLRAYFFKGVALDGLERYEDSLLAFQKALSINPNGDALGYVGGAKAALGDRAGALSVIEQLIATEDRKEPAILIAYIYGCLGDASKMFAWLEKAVQNKSIPYFIVLLSPHIRPYRSDPRYHSFLTSIGLSQLVKS